jgi:hypothetical protein
MTKNLFHPLRAFHDQDWWIWTQVCTYARYSILLNILGSHCVVYLHLWMIHACKYTIHTSSYTDADTHLKSSLSQSIVPLIYRHSMLCALCDLNAVSDVRDS